MPNRTMINENDILHEHHSRDFACHTGKETAGLLCIVSYHHEIVVELGEYGFYTFADASFSGSSGTELREQRLQGRRASEQRHIGAHFSAHLYDFWRNPCRFREF